MDEDIWPGAVSQRAAQIIGQLALYAWHAVLAYAADLGFGLQTGLTRAQYVVGQDLFWYKPTLINVPFLRDGPIQLPLWMMLPVELWNFRKQ